MKPLVSHTLTTTTIMACKTHLLHSLPQRVVRLPIALIEYQYGIADLGAVGRGIVNELLSGGRVSDQMPLDDRRVTFGPLESVSTHTKADMSPPTVAT